MSENHRGDFFDSHCNCEIIFEEFQPVCITIHQRYRRTDRRTDWQTTSHRNTALCAASHGKDLELVCSITNQRAASTTLRPSFASPTRVDRLISA